MKNIFIRTLQTLALFLFLSTVAMAQSGAAADIDPLPAAVPVPGTVTMVDLGAHSCIPCKMMAPVLEKMEKAYSGRAAILFIDVWQHPEQGQMFGIKAIPTQIFFDHTGKEVFRHAGFYSSSNIVEILDPLLAKQEGK